MSKRTDGKKSEKKFKAEVKALGKKVKDLKKEVATLKKKNEDLKTRLTKEKKKRKSLAAVKSPKPVKAVKAEKAEVARKEVTTSAAASQKNGQPKTPSTADSSANYSVREAIAKLRALKTAAEVEKFTGAEKRVSVKRVVPGVLKKFSEE